MAIIYIITSFVIEAELILNTVTLIQLSECKGFAFKSSSAYVISVCTWASTHSCLYFRSKFSSLCVWAGQFVCVCWCCFCWFPLEMISICGCCTSCPLFLKHLTSLSPAVFLLSAFSFCISEPLRLKHLATVHSFTCECSTIASVAEE